MFGRLATSPAGAFEFVYGLHGRSPAVQDDDQGQERRDQQECSRHNSSHPTRATKCLEHSVGANVGSSNQARKNASTACTQILNQTSREPAAAI